MQMIFIFFTIAAFLLVGCSPPTPLECGDQQVKDKLIEEMKHSLAIKTSAIMQQGINANILSIDIESTKTIEKDKGNPFYRKCEMSFTMPGMFFFRRARFMK